MQIPRHPRTLPNSLGRQKGCFDAVSMLIDFTAVSTVSKCLSQNCKELVRPRSVLTDFFAAEK